MFRILRVITLTVTFSIILWLLSAQRGEGLQIAPVASAQPTSSSEVVRRGCSAEADAQPLTNNARSSAIAPPLSSG